jgi:hypothetical protein
MAGVLFRFMVESFVLLAGFVVAFGSSWGH